MFRIMFMASLVGQADLMSSASVAGAPLANGARRDSHELIGPEDSMDDGAPKGK